MCPLRVRQLLVLALLAALVGPRCEARLLRQTPKVAAASASVETNPPTDRPRVGRLTIEHSQGHRQPRQPQSPPAPQDTQRLAAQRRGQHAGASAHVKHRQSRHGHEHAHAHARALAEARQEARRRGQHARHAQRTQHRATRRSRHEARARAAAAAAAASPLAGFTDAFQGGGMTRDEQELLARTYAHAHSVFEWGMGSSTLIAAHVGIPRLTAVDSAVDWVQKCRQQVDRPGYSLRHADVGAIVEFGTPKDSASQHLWPGYSRQVDGEQGAFDVYLVDGRFRVACACRALLHGRADSLVLVHDFERPAYHVLLDVADQLERVGKLAVLRRKLGVNAAAIERLWARYQVTPERFKAVRVERTEERFKAVRVERTEEERVKAVLPAA